MPPIGGEKTQTNKQTLVCFSTTTIKCQADFSGLSSARAQDSQASMQKKRRKTIQ